MFKYYLDELRLQRVKNFAVWAGAIRWCRLDRLCKESVSLSPQGSTRGLQCQSQLGTNPPHLSNSRQLLDSFQTQRSPVSDMLIRRRQPQSALCYLDVSATVLLQALSSSFRKLAQCCTYSYVAKHHGLYHSLYVLLLTKCWLAVVWCSELSELGLENY
jgi:hypothetical protein